MSAYFVGATFKAYLDFPYCDDREAVCRIVNVAGHPSAVLLHPLVATKYLLAATHV
ncbi:MAG TPA: hypothetical protein VHU19_03975 [Pyrinomonadaceae bacterium]|nr:hypothetical protein [Pyrinomonadaceae bacterium]